MGTQQKPRAAMLRRLAAVTATAVLAGLVIHTGTSQAATADITTLLGQLPVFAEHDGGYDRDYFNHWIDADTDGCDTREEVLIFESVTPPTTGAGCSVTGQWFSYYDAATWTDPADVDIDHMVPLEEAWGSGAHVWTFAQREAFANDLTLPASLVAVTDNVNQSKGAQDPAEWLPPDTNVHCQYVTEWVLVKYRWNLSVDPAEATTLANTLAGCGATNVPVPPKGGTPTPQPPTARFSDVPTSSPFFADIEWLATSGITTGYPDGTFKPTNVVTRGQMATYLYRYTKGTGTPAACTKQWFPDVPKTSSVCPYVFWLAGTGITGGYPDGTFRPSEPVSRKAMAMFLKRYRTTKAATSNTCSVGEFTDMPAGSFCPPITWVSANGIAGGFPDGSFRPEWPVGRQAMASFMHAYDQLFGPSNPPIVVQPPTTTTTKPPTTTTTKPPIPPNPGDSKNCTSFATWSQAQAWFNTYFPYYGDVANLDNDGDGIACESLPGAP